MQQQQWLYNPSPPPARTLIESCATVPTCNSGSAARQRAREPEIRVVDSELGVVQVIEPAAAESESEPGPSRMGWRSDEAEDCGGRIA
mgnify:CR=1 FL=1